MRDTELYDEETDTYYGLDYVDEDDDFDRYHCDHGTYIGTPGGPDILCGWCEDGISVEHMKDILHDQRVHRIREKAKIWIFGQYVELIYPTFKQIPGGFDKDKFRGWADSVRSEIESFDEEYLLSIEKEVYS